MIRPRVLVADERATMRRWISAALEPLGVAIAQVPSGRRALRALVLEGPFDLVIAHAALEHPSGLKLAELTRRFRGSPIPFILTTSAGDEAIRATLSELGDAMLLDEPFDEGSLQTLVEQALSEGVFTGQAEKR